MTLIGSHQDAVTGSLCFDTKMKSFYQEPFVGGGINQEYGTNRYTLLYIK